MSSVDKNPNPTKPKPVKSSSLDDSKMPEDLNSLKKKLNKLMCAIDEVSLKEENVHLNQINSSESRFKFLESLHAEISDRLIDVKLNVRESVLKSLDAFESTIDEALDTTIGQDDYNPKRIRKNTDINANLLMEKSFRLRESPITELMKAREEFQTLKNMALALMTLFFINLMIQDYIDHGAFINIKTLTWCFSGVDMVITTWILMFLYCYLVIWLVKSTTSYKVSPKIWLPLYAIYQGGLMTFACFITVYFSLSFGSSMIILCECTRMMMKIHSYLRTKMLYGWGENRYKNFLPEFVKDKIIGNGNAQLNLPEISIEDSGTEVQRFTYFMFAPTLLYRDSYLLRSRCDWRFIGNNIIEFLFGIYYTFILYRIYLQPKFIVMGKEESWNNVLLMSMIQILLPSFLGLFILFYIVIHSTQNIFAELLRFPDRRFYEDWWNSMNIREFVRKFITVNHEWFYCFIYMDLMRFSNGKIKRHLAQFITFAFSSVIHFVVISFSLGFVGIEQFLIFTVACYVLTHRGTMKKHAFNILFWVEICFGIALMMTMYSRDYYRKLGVQIP